MNCTIFSQQLGSTPSEISEDMRAHMTACATCQTLYGELVDFDQILRAALDVDVPAGLGVLPKDFADNIQASEAPAETDNVVPLQSKTKARPAPLGGPQFAIAATLLLSLGVFLGTWIGRISAPLPQGVIAHVEHEPYLFGKTWSKVPVATVTQVLSDGRVSLNGDIGTVRHAGLCSFRGNKVAHLVVESTHGPVTIMLLPEESTAQVTPFNEEGYAGVLIPVGAGSIAIISDDSKATEEVEKNLSEKVAWTI